MVKCRNCREINIMFQSTHNTDKNIFLLVFASFYFSFETSQEHACSHKHIDGYNLHCNKYNFVCKSTINVILMVVS